MNVCANVSVRMCVRACVHACVRDVFAIYDNNTLTTLIIIIIKIVFLYFTEIAPTDYFPSTGTRLVQINTRAGDPISPRFWMFFAYKNIARPK